MKFVHKTLIAFSIKLLTSPLLLEPFYFMKIHKKCEKVFSIYQLEEHFRSIYYFSFGFAFKTST
jgi:hypothetical protein